MYEDQDCPACKIAQCMRNKIAQLQGQMGVLPIEEAPQVEQIETLFIHYLLVLYNVKE